MNIFLKSNFYFESQRRIEPVGFIKKTEGIMSFEFDKNGELRSITSKDREIDIVLDENGKPVDQKNEIIVILFKDEYKEFFARTKKEILGTNTQNRSSYKSPVSEIKLTAQDKRMTGSELARQYAAKDPVRWRQSRTLIDGQGPNYEVYDISDTKSRIANYLDRLKNDQNNPSKKMATQEEGKLKDGEKETKGNSFSKMELERKSKIKGKGEDRII